MNDQGFPNKKDFLNKLKNIPEVKPDKEDLEAINRINANDYNGRISLRVPKSLHADLIGLYHISWSPLPRLTK